MGRRADDNVLVKKACIAVASVAAVLVASALFIAHDDVSRLRASLRAAPPVPPLVRSAIVAAEDPQLFSRPAWSLGASIRSLRALRPWGPRVMLCAPTLLGRLVRGRAVNAQIVAAMFTPDEVLRIYAHEVYMGRVDGRDITGIENASRVYFGKPPAQLTRVEAATLAAMIVSPNVLKRDPERLHTRRDLVLARMAAPQGARP